MSKQKTVEDLTKAWERASGIERYRVPGIPPYEVIHGISGGYWECACTSYLNQEDCRHVKAARKYAEETKAEIERQIKDPILEILKYKDGERCTPFALACVLEANKVINLHTKQVEDVLWAMVGRKEIREEEGAFYLARSE